MTWEEALEAVIARTGHERFYLLCSEANPCPHSREAYRALMLRLASGWTPPPATRPTAATTGPDPWRERIRECPDYQPGCCSSPSPFCGRFGINPTRERCIECLSRDS